MSCVGVVVHDGMVLCVRRRDDNRWEPPTGVLEGKETLSQCAEREVLEETGVSVVAEAVSGIYRNVSAEHQPLAIGWRCVYLHGEPRGTAEAAEALWLAAADAIKRMPPAIAVRVVDAMTAHTTVLPVRTHDGWELM